MSFDLKLENGSFSVLNGEATLVTALDKLTQDVLKIIITEIGTVKLHSWYGTNLNSSAVGSVNSKGFLKAEITRSVSQALNNLKMLQEQNERAGQILSPREVIARIDNIEAIDTTDPRQLIINIMLTTRAGVKITESLPLFL